MLSRFQGVSQLLLVRLRSLGDSILTIPLIEALASWRPHLRIDVLVEAPYAPVFQHHPAVRETLVLRPTRNYHGSGVSRARMMFEVLRRRYDAVLNLHGGSTSLAFTLGSAARLRIGQETFRWRRAYNVLIPPSAAVWGRTELHTVEHQLSLLRWLGVHVAPSRGRLFVTGGAQQNVRRRLDEACIAGKYILIHPAATLRTKQWEARKFAQVADRLSREAPVILTSAPHESQILLEVGRYAREKHCYWSDLPLQELFSLIAGASLFVGNDSGPTHAAAALDRRIVVVWGSSNPRTWHPWQARYERIGSDLPCIPCPGYTCAVYGEPRCILEVEVERVLDACLRMLLS